MKARNIVILVAILAVLGGVFYAVARPKPGPPPKPEEYVWQIQQEDIEHVTISLPHENLSRSFIKISQGDKFPWFFDDAQHSPVNAQIWGGGIPLLLSGPGADRVINENASPEQLTEYGFDDPRMKIDLLLTDNKTMTISVGDQTPTGNYYFVLAPNTNAVATVDYTWYGVLERIVKSPDVYARPTTTAKP